MACKGNALITAFERADQEMLAGKTEEQVSVVSFNLCNTSWQDKELLYVLIMNYCNYNKRNFLEIVWPSQVGHRTKAVQDMITVVSPVLFQDTTIFSSFTWCKHWHLLYTASIICHNICASDGNKRALHWLVHNRQKAWEKNFSSPSKNSCVSDFTMSRRRSRYLTRAQTAKSIPKLVTIDIILFTSAHEALCAETWGLLYFRHKRLTNHNRLGHLTNQSRLGFSEGNFKEKGAKAEHFRLRVKRSAAEMYSMRKK